MAVTVFLTFVDLFVRVFSLILLARVILSYFMTPGNAFYDGLVNVTEPVLAPVRKLLPAMGGLDLAPLVTFFLLQGVQILLHSVVGSL